jgi:amino acid adenylation domain-containing protein
MQQDLLAELHRRGIRLRLADDDRLDVLAPAGSLTPELRDRLRLERAGLIAMLRRTSTQEGPRGITPDPVGRHQSFPLTPVQHAYWIGRIPGVELGGVFTHFYIELDGRGLDLGQLNKSLGRVIERHDMLRAVIDLDGRQQILAETPPYDISCTDLSTMSEEGRDAALGSIRAEMSHQSLSPEEWPMFDIRVCALPGGRSRLHVNIDNVIADAASLDVLFRDWQRFYEDDGWAPEQLELSYRDYVLAQEAQQQDSSYAAAREYWLGRLESLPAAPALPLAVQGAQLVRPEFTNRYARLPRPEWAVVRQAARKRGLTPSAVVMTAFADVMRRWSRQPDFTLNLTLFNRQAEHPQLDQLVGDFTGLVLLQASEPPAGSSFADRARTLNRQLLQDLEHSAYDGVRVLQERARKLAGGPGAAMPVVFSSGLALSADETADGAAAGGRAFFGERVHSLCETPQVWLDSQVSEEQGALCLSWDTVDALFPAGMLDSMFEAYFDAIALLARDESAWDGGAPLACLPDWQAAERADANDTAAEIPVTTLYSLVEERAAAQPGALAVVDGDGRSYTFGELTARARRLARRLREAGAAPDTLIAVAMDKGADQAVAVLGVVGSGAAYLPIDPSWPQARREGLLEQGQARIVVTSPQLRDTLPWPAGTCLVTLADPEVAAASDGPLDAGPAPSDLAYVIFTSGSTGTPKGVMIEHAAAANTIQDINQRFGVGPGDSAIALSALSFDLSVYDIFGMLAAGATCVIPGPAQVHDPASWTRLIERHRVTIWNSVPALIQAWLDGTPDTGTPDTGTPDTGTPDTGATAGGSLRLAMLSGDWIPVTLPDAIRGRCPGASVMSLGGATEAAIWSITFPVGEVPADWDRIPYGKPLANQRMHVYGTDMRDTPVWATGEIWIAGAGLARGYWADAEKTAQRFVTHPVTGERLYRTGDMGRYLPGGDIEFLGREDSQVKLNGYRIELGEIAAALRRVPGVAEALVTAATNPATGGKQLVAYVLPDKSALSRADGGTAAEPTPASLHAALEETLPDYMIPRHYVTIDEIPLSANAKVDLSRLPAPWTSAAPDEAAAPADDLERRLLEIWCETLGRDDFGIADNLFELGGDSLHAVRILGRVRDEFGIEGSAEEGLQLIFASPTIAELAVTIRSMSTV